jgi:hypothetical protein
MIWYNEALNKCSNGRIAKYEEALLQKFPHRLEQLLEQPSVILDTAGCIILWYLPDAISPWIQVSLFVMTDWPAHWPTLQAKIEEATISMGSLLQKSMTGGMDTKWRIFLGNSHTSDWQQLTPGCINLAPCWFQQGWEVSTASSPECPCSCRCSSHIVFHRPMDSPPRCQSHWKEKMVPMSYYLCSVQHS